MVNNVAYMIKNQFGGFSPIKITKFKDENEALSFYINNKDKYRKKGVFLQLVNID